MDMREAIDGWLASIERREFVKQAQAANDDPDPAMPAGARSMIDGKATRQAIFDTLKSSVAKRFPIEDDKYRLELHDVDYDGPTDYSLEQQKQAILHNRKLGCSLKGTWRLIDKSTGKVVEEKRDAVMRVPYYTNRGTIINNGSEYTVINQARLSPGVYTRRKQNGDLESQFNVANGKGFRLTLDKSTGRMNFRMGQANLPLYPILRSMGVTDKQLADSWGSDVAFANSEKNDPKTVQKLYEKIAGYKMDPLMTPQNQAKFIQEELGRFGLDPNTVVRTLGIENVKGVTPEVLLRASQKLLNVNRGVEEPDNRDNPRFSKFYGIEHMLGERVDKDAAKLLKPMLFKIRRDGNLSRVGRNALGPYIDNFLSTSGLAQPGEEANPMSILIQQSRITRTGEGGISSPDLITPEARGVQGDYLGFVDFIATPESTSAGVDVRASYGTVLGKDNKLYNVFRNMQTGKKEYLSLDQAADKTIAFPDQDPKAPYMYCMRNGVPTRVKTSEVDYMVPSFSRTIGAGINMNPMPTATYGQRSFYSSKFWEQYLPQKEGEVPFVDSLMPDGKTTFNEYYGRKSGCVTAPFSGVVTGVTKDSITVKGKNGRTQTFDVVTNLPYNRMSVTGDTEVLIRRGGTVTKLKIEDYVQSAEDEILSYDPDTMKSGWSKISGFTRHANIKQLYRVTYKSGRHVDVTEDHSLITLSDTFSFIPIYPKDCHIGKTRSPIVHGDPGLSSGWSYDQGVVDGLYLSEGSLRGLDSGGVYHTCSIACLPKERRTYLASVLRSLGFRPQPASIVRTRARTSLISGRHVSGSDGEVAWTSKELAMRWKEDFGVHSYGKRIGGNVFGRGREYLHGLLAGYMAGDGCLHQDTYGSVQIEASTVSRQLRDDLVAVCTMLGLMVMLRGPRRNGDGCRPLYTFRISTGSASSLSPLFAYPDRQRKLESLLSHTFNSTVGGHKAMWYEHVPVLTARARRFLYSCASGKVSDYIYKSTGMGAVSKRRITAYAGKPGMIGRSDILWDVVSDIRPIAHQDYVYDFSVDGSEAFALANGLLVHNTQLTYTPVVKKGMEVKEGDILAHSNFTDPKTGAFNMGRNLKVAILPGPRGANSVTGDTFVFWRKPDGAYTFTPISEAIPWGGMKSIAMDQKTLDHCVADCMSWMIHRPDSPLYEVTLQDGYKVVVTGSHGLMRYNGRSGIESCRADQVLNGDLMPFVKARIPYGTGDSVVKYAGLHRSSRNYELAMPLDREFGWFIGIYLAEGCVAYRKSGGKEQPGWINIACTEREIIDHITAACKRMGASYRYVSPGVSKTGVRYGGVMKIHHSALCHFLADNAGRYAWGKRIPDCLWTAPREFAEGLVDGYFCGDGTVGDRQATATTTSRALAEALCLVLSSFGIRANCRKYKFSTPKQKHPAWLVTILGEHLSRMPFISLSRKRVLLEKLASVRSCGKFSRDRVPVPRALRGRCAPDAFGIKRQVPYLSYIGRNKYRSHIPEGVSKDADSLFARTDIWWDVVKSVRLMPASERNDSIVYDLDMSPYGTFMVGYGLIVHNSFEDALIFSEDAAKKLSTSRLYNFDQDTKNGVSINKNKFLAAFPDEFTKEQAETLDASGVVKVGTELHRGDPIIAAVGPKLLSAEDAQLGKLSSVLKNAITNKSQTWNHDWPGVVTDVVAGPSGAKVLIKSEPPLKVGDKAAPRFALKGVTGTILPMDKMPRDAVTNEPYDMIMNPMGFLSRVAPGQLMEIALGKVAKKTGRQIRIPQLPPPGGWLNWTKQQLADAGVKDTADVFDPQTGRTIKNVGDGYMYVQAMHHLAEKKYSARGIEGGYTQDQQPAKGGETGAKKISGFDTNALLSHGATEVLRDAMTIRGQKNEEYWRKLRLGLPVPEPDVPFIYKKFLGNLKAGGINVVEKGDITSLMPHTDATIEKLAEGRVIDSAQMVDANMNPVKGGLFDLGKTGGAGGTRWSMIELPEPVPNPVMEEPVRRVLGLTAKGLSNILSGREQLDGKTGGAAVKAALEKVDVDRLIMQARNDIKSKRGSARDNAVKVLGYLTSAKNMKVSPAEWMISKVPVLPPAFRPISKVGDVALVPDTNELYKELLENKHNYELLKKDLPDSALTDERLNIYKSVKAAFGLGDSITSEGQAKNLKGPIRQVIGTVPKWGQFQSKVVAKNQDLVGRSVTVPDKNLSMDQVGIPEDMAWTMYKPFVTRKLVQRGYSPVNAAKMIEDRTPAARHILDDVMEEKPVLMDRAPTWHKFNIMAFRPFITDGKEIRVCPMIDSGFNMDHDGDLQIGQICVKIEESDIYNFYKKFNPTRCKSMLNMLYFMRLKQKETRDE